LITDNLNGEIGRVRSRLYQHEAFGQSGLARPVGWFSFGLGTKKNPFFLSLFSNTQPNHWTKQMATTKKVFVFFVSIPSHKYVSVSVFKEMV